MIDLRTTLQTTLGDGFVVERELGGGGMSRVFIAEDATLRRRIVVKILPMELAGDVSIARFQREIGVAARLQHPHIVPLLSTGETSGVPFYTMPFVEGETLRARLSRAGELPVAEAVRLLREMATALAYAHDKGVVHRDIKPENVLLSGGIALVTDFGVAKALLDSTTTDAEPLTATGVSVGTPAYMSPEQVSADPSVDHRADIYAFGMVAYEMLAGQSPFAGRTGQSLLSAHVIDAPEALERRRPAVPPALAGLIMRCLEKRPADRPQNANEIVQALDAVTTPSQTIATPRTSLRFSRAALAAGAVVVLAVVGAGAAWFRFGRSTPPAASSSRLLVAPFENLTGDPRYDYIGRVAADRISQIVAALGSIDVVPSNMVLMALRDTTGGTAQRLDKLSNGMHASLLMSGTVVLRGDSLLLQGQVTNVRTGRVAHTLVPATAPAADPIAAVDALGDRLIGALGTTRTMSILGGGSRAPKYAAYREFAQGFERFVVFGDVVGSRPYFERAIAIDSTYTRAYQLLGRQYMNAGEFDRADSMARHIERLPQGLSAAERLTLDYLRAELDGDIPGLLRAMQALAARDSSMLAISLTGEAALFMLRPDLAVPAYEYGRAGYDALGGGAGRQHIGLTAEAYHEAGMYDKELRLLVERRPQFPDLGLIRGRQLRAYAGLGQPALALALADSMVRTDPDTVGRLLSDLVNAASEFRFHRDTATATRLLGLARAWITSHDTRTPTPRRRLFEGVTMLASGFPDSAILRLASAAKEDGSFETVGYLALAQAARGDRARARVVADSLGALRRRWLFGRHTYWRAAIMGSLGERDLAVQLLAQSFREGQQTMPTWHYHPALRSLHGFEPFEALVRPRR